MIDKSTRACTRVLMIWHDGPMVSHGTVCGQGGQGRNRQADKLTCLRDCKEKQRVRMRNMRRHERWSRAPFHCSTEDVMFLEKGESEVVRALNKDVT